METLNEENKNQKKFEFNGNWMLAFFILMLIGVLLLGKFGL